MVLIKDFSWLRTLGDSEICLRVLACVCLRVLACVCLHVIALIALIGLIARILCFTLFGWSVLRFGLHYFFVFLHHEAPAQWFRSRCPRRCSPLCELVALRCLRPGARWCLLVGAFLDWWCWALVLSSVPAICCSPACNKSAGRLSWTLRVDVGIANCSLFFACKGDMLNVGIANCWHC